MKGYRFHPTYHSNLRMIERQLSFENMKNVVQYPDKVQDLNTGKHGGKLRKYFKKVENRTLVVIAETKRRECWIATGYYE